MRQEGHELKFSLGYISKFHLKGKKENLDGNSSSEVPRATVSKLEAQEAKGVSVTLNAVRFKTQQILSVWLESEGREKLMSI